MIFSSFTVIADAHIGSKPNDAKYIIEFIQNLNSRQHHALVVLGDLFQIWSSFPKTHNAMVIEVLKSIEFFRSKGGKTIFIAGNRDLFFYEKSLEDKKKISLPFDWIAQEAIVFETTSGKRLVFAHGDQVNIDDVDHLRWRRLMRNSLFYQCIKHIPGKYLRKILIKGEKKMSSGPKKVPLVFPREHWKHFTCQILEEKQARLCVIGHFHPPDCIFDSEFGGLVLSDWEKDRSYFYIDADLQYTHERYKYG